MAMQKTKAHQIQLMSQIFKHENQHHEKIPKALSDFLVFYLFICLSFYF